MAELNITDGWLWRANTDAPLVLALTDADGRTGYGQAIRLAGRSSSTLSASREALVGLIAQLPAWEPAMSTSFLPIGASMAWETAVADLQAQAAGVSMGRYLDPNARASIEANGLVDPATDLRDVVAEGYSCIKVKVGRQTEEEIHRIGLLRELAPTGSIRLDANQAFDASEATAFLKAVSQFDIAYIEEPTANPRDWPMLNGDSGVAIGADESVTSRTVAEEFIENGWAQVLVLKPALWSSPRSVIETARQSQQAGYEVTITSARDGVLGSLLAAHVAAVVGDSPAGLGWGDVRAEELAWTDVSPGPHCELPLGLGVSVDLRSQ